MTSRRIECQLGTTGAFALVVILAACSSPPPPTAEMRGARDSIARAQYDGAPQLASQPFQMAADKLARAQDNVRNKNMDQAKWLAEQSQADADYADAVSVVAKTQQGAAELQQFQQKRQ
jgi:hypothetical protein